MVAREEERYELGYSARFYQEELLEAAALKEKGKWLRRLQVIKAQDMAWEDSPHGRIKHLIHEKMNYPVSTVNLYMMVLPPGGRSGKHRHMAEELLYIITGDGYDMHWDADVEITDRYYWRNKKEGVKYEWKSGDYVYIPPMTAHQHFNASKDKEARFLAARNRIYKHLGYPDMEQLEEAPKP